MAHFRGTCKGDGRLAARLGTKDSGLHVTANGWKSGIEVYAQYSERLSMDVFEVYLTCGSDQHAPMGQRLIGRFTEDGLDDYFGMCERVATIDETPGEGYAF